MAFVCVVASTHYDISQEVNLKLDRVMKDKESTLPKGARLLYNMVSAAHEHLPINPVLPASQFSTDDTTDYIYEGGGKKRRSLD